MKVHVDGWYSDIYLNSNEVNELCKPGMGDDTCIYLLVGDKGFQCAFLHGSLVPIHLFDGEGNAKRQGCNFVDKIDPTNLGLGDHEIIYK